MYRGLMSFPATNETASQRSVFSGAPVSTGSPASRVVFSTGSLGGSQMFAEWAQATTGGPPVPVLRLGRDSNNNPGIFIGGLANSADVPSITSDTNSRLIFGTPSSTMVAIARFPNATTADLSLSASGTLGWSAAGGALNGNDLFIRRDAANTLAQRNGTAAQTFRVYETFTDASNGTWFQVQAVSSRYEIGGKANGTGNVRPILLQHGTVAIASLPTASAAGAGARMVVSDALAPTFGATVASGGSVVTPVYSDGTNWKVG